MNAPLPLIGTRVRIRHRVAASWLPGIWYVGMIERGGWWAYGWMPLHDRASDAPEFFPRDLYVWELVDEA